MAASSLRSWHIWGGGRPHPADVQSLARVAEDLPPTPPPCTLTCSAPGSGGGRRVPLSTAASRRQVMGRLEAVTLVLEHRGA